MKFQIQTQDNKTIELTVYQLVQMLVTKQLDCKNGEHVQLVETVMDYFEVARLWKTTSLAQLFIIVFRLGYYYRIFLEKNEVKVDVTEATSEGIDES